MTDTPLLDWTPAERRDDGMQRAVDHADAVVHSWSDRAGELLLEYAAQRRGSHVGHQDSAAIMAGTGIAVAPLDDSSRRVDC